MFEKEELEVIVFKKFFSVEIPKGWEFDEEEGVVSFFKEGGGVGALQVSFLKSGGVIGADGDGNSQSSEDISKDMLALTMAFAENLGIDIAEDDMETVTIDKSHGTYFSFDDGGTLWKVWAIKGFNKIAPIMYCCSSDDRDNEELKVIDFIVNSFKWEYDDGDYDNDYDNNKESSEGGNSPIN